MLTCAIMVTSYIQVEMVLVGNSLVFSEAVESAEENEAWRRRGSKLGAPTLPKAVE